MEARAVRDPAFFGDWIVVGYNTALHASPTAGILSFSFLPSLTHRLASGPGPFGPNFTVSQNQTRSGPALHSNYDPACLWKNATESESGKLVAGRLRSAGTGPDDSCS